MDQGSLFDRTPIRPTTRQIATLVKAGGVDALPDAVRRADEATYQEITCRSALNAVKGMPFKWTLNPYRGCTHACHYCFARRYQTQIELGAGDEFSSVILVKVNLARVLERELARPGWARESVAIGTATDPYQPIEGRYRLTRRAIELLARSGTPFSVVTKGPMIVRDADLLADAGRRAGATVFISVPTVDEEAWRVLEPGTAHPLQRLRAARALVDAGVKAGILMAPLVPRFNTQAHKVEATIEAIAALGLPLYGGNVLYLDGGTRTHFMAFLARERPDLVEGYERLFVEKYAPAEYRTQVRDLVRRMRRRYDVPGRAGGSQIGEEPLV